MIDTEREDLDFKEEKRKPLKCKIGGQKPLASLRARNKNHSILCEIKESSQPFLIILIISG